MRVCMRLYVCMNPTSTLAEWPNSRSRDEPIDEFAS